MRRDNGGCSLVRGRASNSDLFGLQRNLVVPSKLRAVVQQQVLARSHRVEPIILANELGKVVHRLITRQNTFRVPPVSPPAFESADALLIDVERVRVKQDALDLHAAAVLHLLRLRQQHLQRDLSLFSSPEHLPLRVDVQEAVCG